MGTHEQYEMDDDAPELDAVVKQLCGLARESDAERRRAATLMLGDVGGKFPEVLDALRAATKDEADPTLRRMGVLALGRIGPKSIAHDLSHVLDDADERVRNASKEVLRTTRAVKSADLEKLLSHKEDKQRLLGIAVVGARGGRDAWLSLIPRLDDGSGKVRKAIEAALATNPPQTKDLDEILDTFETHAHPARFVERVDVAGNSATILGYLADPRSARMLVETLKASGSSDLSAKCLRALHQVWRQTKVDAANYGSVLEFLQQPGLEQAVVAAALESLSVIDIPLEHEPRVCALVRSDRPAIRAFALASLGGLNTSPAAKALAETIQNGTPDDRQVALEAGVKTTEGRDALARLALALDDEESVRRVVDRLRPHADELPPSTVHHLEEGAVERPPEIAKLIIGLLRARAGGAKAEDSLVEKARRLKKKGSYKEAAELLRRVFQTGDGGAEARFELGVCELKLSKKKLTRGGSSDPCIDTFQRLARVREFPLVARLQSEHVLEGADLYFLGFSLMEAGGPGEGVGGDLLMTLAESDEDEQLKTRAHNKLKTMGWLDD